MYAAFHDKIEDILAYLKEANPLLRVQPVDGGSYQRISQSDVAEYFKATSSYWGAYPETFIVADGESISWALDLEATFTAANALKPKGFFMLLGYNDGGVFSVAPEPMPFQFSAVLLSDYRMDLPSPGSFLTLLSEVWHARGAN
ncbi:hypothetical protein KX729_07495 [Rhizobium sp. XQZ8]|uniref:hypothetical protein n=1 Tax=Rhizobium populisoli TaxID=2859785 RepID=UPI001CA5A4EB|nr:hypothetical protein [Rhizobium populisoli]MBW6421281.1 hypothetical protein [Rhizobium populisoli]